MPDRPQRIIIAITGATGAVYGVRLLQQLQHTANVETHLIVSDAAVLTLHQETGLQRREVEALGPRGAQGARRRRLDRQRFLPVRMG